MVNKYTIIFAIVVLAVVITYQNLGLTYNFIGEDSGVAFDFPRVLSSYTYNMWDEYTGPGKINVTSTFNFIWLNLVIAFHKIGISGIMIKRLLYGTFISVSGIGAFFLLRLFLSLHTKGKERAITSAAAIGSLLYIFNHFNMLLLSFPINPYHVSYLFLPWFLYLFIRNIFLKSTFVSTVIFSFICVIILSSNPSNTVSIIVLSLGYFAYFFNTIPDKKKAFRFIGLSALFTILLSSFILLPMLLVPNPYGDVGSTSDLVSSLAVHSIYTPFYNVLRLAAPADWMRYPYASWYDHHPVLLSLAYIFPFVALSSFLFRSHTKVKLFFALVALVTLFFAKGSHPPFEQFFISLFTTIPFFGIYRAAYAKFIYFAALSYAVLSTFFLYQAHEKLKRYQYYGIVGAVLLAIAIYYFPYFTGQLVHQDNLTLIPQEYKTASQHVSNDPSDFRMLSLPPAPRGSGLLLQWERGQYVGPHPDSFFFGAPVIDSYWFITKGYADLTSGDSWLGTRFEQRINNIVHVAPFLNITYLIVHKDFLNEHSFGQSTMAVIDGTQKATELQKQLATNPDVTLVEDNTYYNLYKLADTLRYPKIYSPEVVVHTTDPLKGIFTTFQQKAPDKQYLFVEPDVKAVASTQAQVRYTKISPNEYRIHVTQAKQPLSIILTETHHEKWTIEQVAEEHHFVANGYANGWTIDPKQLCAALDCETRADGTQDFELRLVFPPQRIFITGYTISLTTFVILSISAFLIFFKTYYHEKKHT